MATARALARDGHQVQVFDRAHRPAVGGAPLPMANGWPAPMSRCWLTRRCGAPRRGFWRRLVGLCGGIAPRSAWRPETSFGSQRCCPIPCGAVGRREAIGGRSEGRLAAGSGGGDPDGAPNSRSVAADASGGGASVTSAAKARAPLVRGGPAELAWIRRQGGSPGRGDRRAPQRGPLRIEVARSASGAEAGQEVTAMSSARPPEASNASPPTGERRGCVGRADPSKWRCAGGRSVR